MMQSSYIIAVVVAIVIALAAYYYEKKGTSTTPTAAATLPTPPAASMVYISDPTKITYVPGQKLPSPTGVCPSNMPYGLVTHLCTGGTDSTMVNGGKMKCTDEGRAWFTGCMQAKQSV